MEEKKIEDASVEETKIKEETIETKESESDFADEVKIEEPAPVEEVPEKEPQPEVNLYKEEEDSVPEETAQEIPNKGKEKDKSVSYEYRDDNLAAIEKARGDFHKAYKKENIIKWIITGVSLALIVVGYIIPNTIPALKGQQAGMYITLGVLAGAILILGGYSFFSKKKLDRSMNDYFAKFYDYSNKYSFSNLGISNLSGGVSDKIQPEELSACNLYENVVKVGSRNLVSFDYHDNRIKVVDCAAQTKAEKSLRTVFVGKMIVAPNHYEGDDMVIYLKGNKRALPPTNLAGLDVLEDHTDYVVYGKKGSRKGFTKKSIEAIKELHTDKTLIDVAVALRAGNTYFLMGYEDTLMVLPLEKAFDPAPTEHYRDDLKKVLVAIDAINGFKEKE